MSNTDNEDWMPNYRDTQRAFRAVSAWAQGDQQGVDLAMTDAADAGRRDHFDYALVFLCCKVGGLADPDRFRAWQQDLLSLASLAEAEDGP